jgi:16S rRNA U1498 N3-methylase RsmE
MSTPQHHTVNGRKTTVGDVVHYTDQQGAKHAAKIEAITGSEAHLRTFHAGGSAQDSHEEAVPHSATGAPHSWTHFPE